MSTEPTNDEWKIILAAFVVLILVLAISGPPEKKCPSQATIKIYKTWAATEGGVRTASTAYYLADTDGVTYRLINTGDTPMPEIFGRIQSGQTLITKIDTCQAQYYQGITPIILEN